jgi:hypothetical protein
MGFNVKRGVVVVLAAMAIAGCGGGGEGSSTVVGDAVDTNCSVHQTGELLYSNSGNDAMKVVINGLDYGVIKPGQTLRANLDAGFQSTVRSSWQDGSTACSTATVPIIGCQSQTIACNATH